jgi:phospholipase B1
MRLFLLLSCLAGLAFGLDYKAYKQMLAEIVTSEKHIADFIHNLNHIQKTEPHYFDYTPFKHANLTFDCDVNQFTSPQVPTSVHELRPSDIQVVAALGDSLTAALGANARTIVGLLFEYRGRGWSMGGDQHLESLVTMPNILKRFNADLAGYSRGYDLYPFNEDGVGFNAAVSGQEANHLPAQARRLIDRLRESRRVDFDDAWKMITIFIGGNDLCDFCNDRELHSPQSYAKFLQQTLDMFYKELPRTFVNLVQVLNVTDVRDMNKGLICSFLHHRTCPCAAFPANEQTEQELQTFLKGYHTLTEELVSSGRYDQRDDFTVVLQPFFTDLKLPRLADNTIDFSYMAPDCFHLSQKGHGNDESLFNLN